MDSILQALGLSNLFSSGPFGNGMSQQTEKPGGSTGQASIPQSASMAGDASMSAGGAKPGQAPLTNAMMQMLMASMLAQPTAPPAAPSGGPAPYKAPPFQYAPMGAPMAVGPRGRL